MEGGLVVPSTGAFTASIEIATDRKAYVLGKPNGLLSTLSEVENLMIPVKYACKEMGVKTNDVAIIGDRMDSTIIAGTKQFDFLNWKELTLILTPCWFSMELLNRRILRHMLIAPF
jgi:hypothetical protein